MLNIKVTKTSLEKDTAKLRTLAAAHPAFLGTQTLRIGPLAPEYDPESKGPTWKYIDGEWVAGPEEQDPPGVVRPAEDLKRYLSDAISSLRGLRRVEYVS